MPRVSQNLPKLLDAAQDLILARGYDATTVDAVCEQAGVTKGSFYHHFASKEALAEALLERWFQRIDGALGPADLGPARDPVERLDRFLSHVVELSRGDFLKHGCIMGVFALELSDRHAPLQGSLAAHFGQLTATVEGLIRAAVDHRPPLQPLDPRALARQLLVALEGGIVLAKAHRNHGLLAESVSVYRTTVLSLFAQ